MAVPRSPFQFCRPFFLQFLLALVLITVSAARADDVPIQPLLHSLDYLAADYSAAVSAGKVIDENEYTEQLQISHKLTESIAALPPKAGRDLIHEDLRQLSAWIEEKATGDKVAGFARNIGHRLAQLYQVRQTPRTVPDLKLGAELYHAKCVPCHGIQGRGDGPMAAELDPPPMNFSRRERGMHRSVYGLYSAITLGVPDTRMRPHHELTESQRWAIAFYVSNFPFDVEDRTAGEQSWHLGRIEPFSNIESVSRMTPAEVETLAGAKGLAQLAYLRAHPEAVMSDVTYIDKTIDKLASSITSYRKGKTGQAYQEAMAAYLEGFELAEPSLQAFDAQLLRQLERQMLAYRTLLKQRGPLLQAENEYHVLVMALDDAGQRMSKSRLPGRASTLSAAAILFEEGFEAVLMLVLIGAIMFKAGRREAMHSFHASWVVAVSLGAVTWLISTQLYPIGGAQRELSEGITALLASALLLLCIGLWMRGGEQRMHGIGVWLMGFVIFLVVYREVFEVLLYYQALWAQTLSGQRHFIGLGIFAGLLGLLSFGWLVARLCAHLPPRLFFGFITLLLFVLALIFAGHGVSGLQEAGMISISVAALPHIEVLGLYPRVETALAQLAVAVLMLSMLIWRRLKLMS